MKIALCGSAPSSMRKAPFGDPSWLIWGCSPGLYPFAPRVDAWFELHRWEPPVIGKADQQVPWFSPEYVLWLAQRACPVWMLRPVEQVPQSQALPWRDLAKKYGTFFFNSSLSWMAAMAIEAIVLNRELAAAKDPRAFPTDVDAIGFWGVDMAADEEIYSGQKSGCQFFATLAASMGIQIHTPPESDLMVPRPMYGIEEETPRHIKLLVRQGEFQQRLAVAKEQARVADRNAAYMEGALDDMKYHMGTWSYPPNEILGAKFEEMPFNKPALATPPQPQASTPATAIEALQSVDKAVELPLARRPRRKAAKKRR